MSRNISFLSLKDWGVVLVITCIIQLGFHLSFNYLKEQERPYDPILNHIKQESSNHSNSALVFGSSLIGYGLSCHDDSIFQQSAGEPPISIFKIWDNGDPFKAFFSSKYIDQIIEINPKVICIQTELAAINLDWINKKTNYVKQISKENKDLKQLLFNPKNQTLNLDEHCFPKLTESMLKTDTLNTSALHRHIKPTDEIDVVLSNLKQLSNAGIKIVIMDIPRPYPLEQIFKDSTYTSNLTAVLNYYQSHLDIEYWEYNDKDLYFSYFLDRGHLNERGKHYYSKWLKQQIITKVFK